MKKILLIIIFLSAISSLYADAGSEFLLLDTSPRGAALSGAFSSSLIGIEGVQYNPASINNVSTFEASIENTKELDDMNFNYFALGSKLLTIPISISFAYYSMDPINIYDMNENINQVITPYDLYSTITAGYKFSDYYTGINIKYIYRKIDSYDAGSIAGDIGVIRNFSIKYPDFFYNSNIDNLKIGMVLKNLGPGIKFESERDNLPTTLILSGNSDIIKNEMLNLTLYLNLEKIFNDTFNIKSGLEISYHDLFFLRIGKSFIYNDAFTYGIGLNLTLGEKTKIQFDYSVITISQLGNNQVLGGTIKF